VGPNNWIYSYDLVAVYHAIRPADPALSEVGPGTNVVTSTGGNSFTMGAGDQYYLQLNGASSLDASIEALLDTLPPSSASPPVISAVGASSISSTGASISWVTDVPADSQVQYGTSTAYGSSSALSSTMTTTHAVGLSGLQANTLYHYRVESRNSLGYLATSSDFTFTTSSVVATSGPSDTFDSNTIDPAEWAISGSGSTVSASNQELEIRHPAGGWTKGSITTVTPYDQTGKSVQIQVIRAANNGLGGSTYGETSLYLWLDATHYAEFFIAGGSLTAWVDKGAGATNLTPTWPRYSASAMQWLRFRESGGVLYWEYASGATSPGTWITLASMADPFAMSAVSFEIVAGSNLNSVDTATFDNVSTY